MIRSNNRNNNLILTVSIILFGLSLSQKCFCTEDNCGQDWEGMALLISGCFGIFSCAAWFSWLANPALLISWLCFKKKTTYSTIINIIALLIGISFLFFREIITNEGGGVSKITSYEIGYWIWISSILLLLIGNLRNMFNAPRSIIGKPN